MNGIFNSGIEWWQALIFLIVAIIGAISIKISFNFDVNKWQERKETNQKKKLMNICPHFEMIPAADNQVEVRSLFIKPPMTLQHQCKKCGVAVYLDLEQHERQANFYLRNPDEYMKAVDRFHKILKKMGRV